MKTSPSASVPTTEARIDVRGLRKSFGSRVVLEDVTFAVEPGTILGFLGANGSGKTTTLRCLLGLAEADSGEALVGGARYRDLPWPARTVGALCENSGLQPRMSALQHLAVELASNDFRGDVLTEVKRLLELVDLTNALRVKVRAMSLGMRQRLGLALALAGEPRILVLDEPANGLDPEGIGWLRQFITHFARRGGCVLITSHQLAELERFITHLAVLSGGRIVLSGAMSDLVVRGDLEQVYLSAIHSDTIPKESHHAC